MLLFKNYGSDGKSAFRIFKRFLDDLIQVFTGTTKQLHELYNEFNQIHPTLIFTMVHTSVESEPEEDQCNCEKTDSIPFLDTLIKIENGKIDIDLFKKKTDRNQYLLPFSCHPKSTTNQSHSHLV